MAVIATLITALSATSGAPTKGGLKAQYWRNTAFAGPPFAERVEALNISTGSAPVGIGASGFSVRWSGGIVPEWGGDTYFFCDGVSTAAGRTLKVCVAKCVWVLGC